MAVTGSASLTPCPSLMGPPHRAAPKEGLGCRKALPLGRLTALPRLETTVNTRVCLRKPFLVIRAPTATLGDIYLQVLPDTLELGQFV